MGLGKGLGMLGCGANMAKIILFIFNFVFWLSGAALLAVGIWAKVDSSSLSKELTRFLEISNENNTFEAAAILFIAVGAFIFVVGFCGCCGAIKESRCLLGIYILLLVLVLLAELAGVIMGVIYRNDLVDAIKDGGKDYLQKTYDYPFTKGTDQAWNLIMGEFKCCGMNGPSDFNNSKYANNNDPNKPGPLPDFCCKLNAYNETGASPVESTICKAEMVTCMNGDCSDTFDQLITKGCYDQGVDYIKDNATIFIGVGAGLGALELLGLLFAVCLCRAIGEDDDGYKA